ncbi:cell envelope integrity protein CreD [Chitinophaga sp. 212800010-3]|uniref:cell envelope integrity protein CreD n=1 Tax=unclassified Chitinophaga TaxID=2619133 RepID=UPI002DE3D9FF|nr:Cell envelope integrity protein CreD [Chitinophaga sp. 212800010-3]
MENTTQETSSLIGRYAYAIKGFILLFLMLVLLVPSVMIQDLIRERGHRQQEATREVSSRWGDEQSISGPVLAVPSRTKPDSYLFLLPENLKVNGELIPQQLHRGIFNVAVYTAKLQLSGNFTAGALKDVDAVPEDFDWQHTSLLMGISDLHGIADQVQLSWNGKNSLFNPGVTSTDLFETGIQTPVVFNPGDTSAAGSSFSLELNVKGSSRISFSPVGKTTHVGISSTWANPGFDDAIPPQKREINSKGFSASWHVSHLNRSYPQCWTGKKFNIHSSDFGIRLLMPVDTYQMATRAVKYAILFIGLTFIIFYFIELAQRRALHPLQYSLIGLALCIFYTLLLSLSEQINFMIAYIIASVLTIGLIVAYTGAAFKSKRIAAGIGGVLTVLYGFIYVIISAEDQSLLMGSLGLFVILALIMYFSTTIKWDKLGQKTNGDQQ